MAIETLQGSRAIFDARTLFSTSTMSMTTRVSYNTVYSVLCECIEHNSQ